MRSVVIRRETLERVRSVVADAFIHTWVQRELLAALDAALSAPEPFERLEDGSLVVGGGPTFYSITTEDNDILGKIIHVYEESHHGYSSYCIGDTADDTRALGFALLAITDEAAR